MRRYINHFRKNQVKALLLFSIVTLTIFVGVSFLTTSLATTITNQKTPQPASTLDIPWSGTGDPQSARAFIEKTSSEISQTDEFEIAVPTSPTVIQSANLNFTIQSTHETTHDFEQDSPLEYPEYNLSSRENPDWSVNEALSPDELSIDTGTPSGQGFTGLVDGDPGTALIVASATVSQEEVGITYIADFTGIRPDYNRLEIIGFRISALRSITRDVIAEISLYNYDTSSWDILYTDNWDNVQVWEQIVLANTNIKYINSTDQVQVRIVLEDAQTFAVTYRELVIEAYIAAQAPLSTLDYAALEFDILGDAEVSGFYAWVRTLTPTLSGEQLTVELYRSNETARRNIVTSPLGALDDPAIDPINGTLLSTNTITNFDTDEYVFIPFKSDYSAIALNVSNYFVVLNASTSNIYAVTTIPYSDNDGKDINNDPDKTVDHLFLVSDNDKTTWERVETSEGQVDAAPFAINVTRAWMPEEIEMKVDGMEVVSYTNTSGKYGTTSGYKWGLGKWNHEFDTEIQDVAGTLTIPIECNISTVDFDVDYTVAAYSVEDTTTSYYVKFDENPSWEVNYTLNTGKYTGWVYKNSSFIVPTDWSLIEFLDSNRASLLSDYEFDVRDELTEYWIEGFTNGIYTLNATSPNYVFETNTYLKYEDELWDTHGFMQGDDIALSLGILNYSGILSPIYSGDSSVEMYDPSDPPLLPSVTMNDISPDNSEAVIVGSENVLLTYYEFDSENLLNTTGATEQGEYSLVFKWKEGNEVGYKLLPIFIMDYEVEIDSITEDLDKRVDVVLSSIGRNLTTAPTYNVSVFAMENITGLPSDGSYHINESVGKFYYDYNFNVNLSQVLVNESLFNPGETVTLNLTFENYNQFWENDVSVNVQFVQSMNYDWIVMEQGTTFSLGWEGSGTENKTVELTFDVPSDYKGINGPIRLNPFVLRIEVNINDEELQPFILDNMFPFIEKTETEFEGQVLMDSLIHHRPGPIGKIFSAEIDRVEELVESNATYLMQISDSYYVACSTSEFREFSSKPIAEFHDIAAIDLIWGSEFQLQGNLTDEFGNELAGQTIDVEVYDGADWLEYNQISTDPLITDSEGFFDGTFDTSLIPQSEILYLNLTWEGNSTVYGTSEEFEFNMLTYENLLQIHILNSSDQLFLKERQENTLIFEITNIGNSTLKDFSINFIFPGIDDWRIGDLEAFGGKQLEPDESIYLEYYVTVPRSFRGDSGIITVNITCENHDSHEIVSYGTSFEITVLTSSFFDNLDGLFKSFFFIGVIALILGAAYYSYKTYKKLQETPQEVKETRPRRGRYVEVAKLQKDQDKSETPEENIDDEEESADLDDLLKEEGLED